MLYVHMGDGFNAATGQNLDQFRGKVLRMNLNGTAPSDNPFYNAANGITARDYVFAYGLRNPFGGAWRASDGEHYQVENGPSVDRLSKIERGVNYGWNGSDASMFINAIYNWTTAHAPVNLTFVEPETFAGSSFPADKMDHLFVTESGPTYASGPQANGKRIVEFVLDANGDLQSGPTTLIEYSGTGRGSVVALAAGPDGLYFSEFYEDTGANGPTAVGARIFRVRYVNPLAGDYHIDGVVDNLDYEVWKSSYSSNLLLAADGNGDRVVDAIDYTVWRNNFGAGLGAAAIGTASNATLDSAMAASYDQAFMEWLPLLETRSTNSGRDAVQVDRLSQISTAHRPPALLAIVNALQMREERAWFESRDPKAFPSTESNPVPTPSHHRLGTALDSFFARLGFVK
jgi:hypothetical protein